MFRCKRPSASSICGRLSIVIGPNGYGKTTFLETEKERLKKAGRDVFFIPSEIKLLDEVRDTVESSQTMEFLLTDLLETRKYISKRNAFYRVAERTIKNKTSAMNDILDEVLSLNGSIREGDFIESNPKRFIKHLVTINRDDVKKKMGSGQRMYLLLKLAASSSKTHIILDEPEKYSHPSLLNGTAVLINNLVKNGKQVYIATHSPKLVSMLEFDFDNLSIINDDSHNPKEIPFDKAVCESLKHFSLGEMPGKNKPYYTDGKTLKDSIQRRQIRQFIEALFSKRIYLCEGANDEILINIALRQFGGYFDDYCIFKAWGKINIPVFAKLFQLMGLDVICLFDVDDESNPRHKKINEDIRSIVSPEKTVEMNPTLENELEYENSNSKDDTLAFIEHIEGLKLPDKFNISVL